MKRVIIVRGSAIGAGLLLGGLLVGYRSGRAFADGPPTLQPLFFGGEITDASGVAVADGPQDIVLRLFDAASAGTMLCASGSPATPITAGRFRIVVDAACVAAMQASADVWTEVQVGTTVMPRTKAGAVPYALESARAAGATGSLAAQIRALQDGLTSARTDITAFGTRITALETAAATTSTSVTSAQSSIGALGTRVTALESGATTAGTTVTGLQSSLASARGDITTLQSGATSLGTRVTALETGAMTTTANLSSVQVQATATDTSVTALTTRVSTLEGTGACPTGYTQNTAVTDIVTCVRGGRDEMVRVGTGLSHFWVDRYEASAWSDVNGGGTQYGANSDNYPATFPDSGQWGSAGITTPPVFAASVSGVTPSRYVTWFQAMEACAASGKHLLTNEQWLLAGSGTPDPGTTNGTGGTCVVNAPGVLSTGGRSMCQSHWGAQDLVGNAKEWGVDWFIAPAVTAPPFPTGVWPAGFGIDGIAGIGSRVNADGVGSSVSLPAAVVRGGDWAGSTGAGLYSLNLDHSPFDTNASFGIRCAIGP